MRPDLKRFSRRQHGLVTRTQALEVLSKAQIHFALRNGELERVVPGVYRVGGMPPTWRQKVLAAVLDGGEGAVASHTAAAALWGLTGFEPKSVEIEVPHGGSRRSELAVVHQTRQLEAIDVTTIDGIPVTRVARTLFDLAGGVSRTRLEDAVDDALIRHLVTFSRLEKRNAALKTRGRPNLDPVLLTWLPDRMPQSVAETRLIRRLVAHGLPVPETQVLIAGYRVDCAYPDDRVIIEVESRRWHDPPRHSERTMQRRNHLTALGYTVLQATKADFRGDGRRIADQVKAVLERRRATG